MWTLNLAAKYLDKSFNTFDEKALGRTPSSRIQDWIGDEIASSFGSDADKQRSTSMDKSQPAPDSSASDTDR
jgi:hypothetical protein